MWLQLVTNAIGSLGGSSIGIWPILYSIAADGWPSEQRARPFLGVETGYYTPGMVSITITPLPVISQLLSACHSYPVTMLIFFTVYQPSNMIRGVYYGK